MKKITILTIILLLFKFQISGQNAYGEASNEMKYWKLRGRIRGDENNRDVCNGFITIGLSQS